MGTPEKNLGDLLLLERIISGPRRALPRGHTMTNLHFPRPPLDRSRPEPDSKSAEPGNAALHTTPSCTNIRNEKWTAQMTSSAAPYNETRVTPGFADPVPDLPTDFRGS